jgi:type 1 glutamine amidotransferase
MKLLFHLSILALTGFTLTVIAADGEAAPKVANVLMFAGKHGRGAHEHNAGALLLKKCLDESGLPVKTIVFHNGEWATPEQLAAADTVLIYCDGGENHLLLEGDRLKQLAKEMNRGCGLVCLHYGVEFPKENGGSEMLDWMGGYFEADWSVNPHWKPDYKEFPKHPVSNGLTAFAIQDEWYFHMRFAEENKGRLTKILTAVAPESTMERPDGPHSGNPTVRKAVADEVPQCTAWAFERKNGGRGFGFTGGHFHKNWGDDNQRKTVLNAILWTAKSAVPEDGVPSKVTAEDLEKNLD